jgi:hypothetical protein
MKVGTQETVEEDMLWLARQKITELEVELEKAQEKLKREITERNNYYELSMKLLKILENLSE